MAQKSTERPVTPVNTQPLDDAGGPTAGELGEHAVIEAIIAAAPSSSNGDDAAVLTHAAPNSQVVATTDMLVEGRHFRRDWSTPEEVGKKAIVQNFADIEAMGARAVAALLAVSVPAETPVSFFERLAAGIESRVAEYSAELVGGDVVSGDQLVISVTAIGSLGGNLPSLRLDRARVGQRVVAHGKIGWSAAGMALLERFGRENVPEDLTEVVAAHCAPYLTPGRGVVARATGATSMTDNSDGLVVDLTTVAARSGVSVDLFAEVIAPGPELVRAGEVLGVDPWQWVLTGGEDHTLVATTANDVPSGFREIGRVGKQSGDPAVTVDGAAPHYHGGWVSF